MKNNILLVVSLSLAAFAVGCNRQPAESQQMDKVQSDLKQTAQDMKDYTYMQKDEFVKTMQLQMTNLNSDLDKLSATVESSSDTVKAEARPKIQALRDQAAKLNQQLANAQGATESTWDSVKADSQKAYAAMTNSVRETRQWLSDKLAP